MWRLTADLQMQRLLLQDTHGDTTRSYSLPTPSQLASGAVLQTPVVLRTHKKRQSFVAAFGACSELWEISYNQQAEDIFDGLVHDYRNHEGLAQPGFLGIRRTRLAQPLDDLLIDTESPHVLGRARWGQGEVQVINLDIRRVRATFHVPPTYRVSLAQPGEISEGMRVLLLQAPPATTPVAPVCVSMTGWQVMPCPVMAQTK